MLTNDSLVLNNQALMFKPSYQVFLNHMTYFQQTKHATAMMIRISRNAPTAMLTGMAISSGLSATIFPSVI